MTQTNTFLQKKMINNIKSDENLGFLQKKMRIDYSHYVNFLKEKGLSFAEVIYAVCFIK